MNSLNAFAIVVPTIAVLIGILLNRQDALAIRAELKAVEIALRTEFRNELNLQIGSLRAEMKEENHSLRAEMKSENNLLRAEMRAEIGSLRAEMIQLRNGIHADMVGLHERVAVVEAKQAA